MEKVKQQTPDVLTWDSLRPGENLCFIKYSYPVKVEVIGRHI